MGGRVSFEVPTQNKARPLDAVIHWTECVQKLAEKTQDYRLYGALVSDSYQYVPIEVRHKSAQRLYDT